MGRSATISGRLCGVDGYPENAMIRLLTIRLRCSRMSDYFSIIFVLTIVVTRVVLLVWPISSPTVMDLRLHHYMYGVVGIVVGLLVHSVAVYAVGFGLFVDELAYVLMGGRTHAENYSALSLCGTVFFALAAIAIRHYLLRPFVGVV